VCTCVRTLWTVDSVVDGEDDVAIDTLSFRPHISILCRKANIICSQIFRSFESREPNFLIALFNTYVRPILEYSSSVWAPCVKIDVANVERVQRLFTKRVLRGFDMSYQERLLHLGLKTLEHRRLYLDLVLLYKIIHGMSFLTMKDIGLFSPSCSHRLRSNGFLLHTCNIACSSLSMHSFTYRVCKLWNALPRTAYSLSLVSFKLFVNKLDLISLAVH
jgi:hypothetical protein